MMFSKFFFVLLVAMIALSAATDYSSYSYGVSLFDKVKDWTLDV